MQTMTKADAPLTMRQLKERGNCGWRTLRQAIATGELRAARINGRGDIRVYESWFQEWMERRANAA